MDGIVGIHVGDMLGTMKTDGIMHRACEELAQRLKFGKWCHGSDLVFTGCETHTENCEISVKQAAYMHKVLPFTVEKTRKTETEDDLRPKEHTALSGIDGSLAVAGRAVHATRRRYGEHLGFRCRQAEGAAHRCGEQSAEVLQRRPPTCR